MKSRISRGAALLFLGAMPFEINFAPEDSTKTTVQLFGGVGQYALINRESEGQVLSKRAVPFSAYLRLGNRRAVYFCTSLLHHIPLYTGGYFQLGFGSGKNPNFDWWLGWGFVGPYDQGDIALFKSSIRLQKHFMLNVLGRVGFTEGISESAIGLGLTYR